MDADLGLLRQHQKHGRLALFGIVIFLVILTFAIITLSKSLSNQALKTNSSASETLSSLRPKVCGKCDVGGGPLHCKAWFDDRYAFYKSAKPKWDTKTLLNKAFSEMDNDNPQTPQYDEESCGYCDLNQTKPASWKPSASYRVVDQLDIDAYNNMCAGVSSNPVAITISPLTTGCTACDFSTPPDGKYDLTDSPHLNRCLFNVQTEGCRSRDPNGDGKLDAGDTSWCPLNCVSQATTQTLNIKAGWNLLSLYVEPSNSTPASVFAKMFEANVGQGGQSNYAPSIFAYENGSWKTYVASRPIQTLTKISAGQGLFVYSHVALSLQVSGIIKQDRMPILNTNDYNLVGITSSTAQPLSALISKSQFPDMKIWQPSSTGDQSSFELIVAPEMLNIKDPVLQPGVAYWIHLNQPSGSPANVPASPGGN